MASHGRAARTIIIHIGTEKTGSTTLQRMLSSNRDILGKAGLLYPRSPGPVVHTGLRNLALGDFSLAGRGASGSAVLPPSEQDMVDALRREIVESGCSTVLVSHEHFSSRAGQEDCVNRLVSAMRRLADDVRVVVFIRPQYELFASAYATRVREGVQERKPRVPHTDRRPYFNYDLMLRPWENAVGTSNVAVRRFGRPYFRNSDLVLTFFDAIGMTPPKDLVQTPYLNASLDARAVEYLRLANTHFFDVPQQEVRGLRSLVDEVLQRLSKPGPLILPAEDLRRMDELFAPSNQIIVGRYFAGELDRLFPPFDSAAYAPSAEFDVSHAVELSFSILLEHHKRLRAATVSAATAQAEPA